MKLRVRRARRLAGPTRVGGDKSISHRAALFAALADGVTEIDGFLEAEDCLATLTATERLGAEVSRKAPGHYRIIGAGRRRLQEPADVIDCGNSGTTARLLLGVLAGQPFWTVLTGDASLRGRPMGRVVEPLRAMGATVVGRAEGARLPLAVRGVERTTAIAYRSPIASAQVKSAVLLAGLYADATVTVREPARSRDHTERMLRQFGVRVESEGLTVTLTPGDLCPTVLRVPGDISSAAFVLAAALTVAESAVTVSGVGINPTRTGFLDALEAMGAGVRIVPEPDLTPPQGTPQGTEIGEPAAALGIARCPLVATRVEGSLVPRMIDEIPALAVVALGAAGVTEIRDAAELRVKESDRIAALARELGKMGARVVERADGLLIEGGAPLRGARVASGGDHRVAMALAVAGLAADGETEIDGADCIATSFPEFAETLNELAGADVISVEP